MVVTSILFTLPYRTGVCWRGMPGKADIVKQYKVGRPIQWGAFASTSTDVQVSKGFTSRDDGVLFRITVTCGKDINKYSFFPSEGEILLSPSHRFIVGSAPYDLDGFTVIDLVQMAGNTFVS